MSGWTLILGHAAQQDLWRMQWSRDVEVGAVILGRHECSGINRYDTGRHVFVRRIIHADRNATDESVDVDYDSVFAMQTLPSRGHARTDSAGSGRTGSDDPGLILGNLHSHPEQVREMSDTDIRAAAWNAANAPDALQGKPTATDEWRDGNLVESWANPTLDPFLVFGDRRVVKPTIYAQSEVEWN